MDKRLPFVLLIFTMLSWATNFHVVKIALEFYSPLGVAAWRFFFGVLTLLIIVYIQFRKRLSEIRFSSKEWGYMFLTSFFGIFLTIYFFNVGLQTTSAVNGSLIIATSPAITATLSFLFLNKKVNLLQWMAIALSFIGVLIILINGEIEKLSQLAFEPGDIFIISMATVFSLSQIIVSKYLSHVDSILMTSISSFMALCLFALLSLPELVSTPLPVSLSFWSSVLFMGVIATGIAYTAFYYCVVKLGATISTLYMNLIPFFVVLLAFPFGETLSSAQIIGGVIIITGILLFGRTKLTESPSSITTSA